MIVGTAGHIDHGKSALVEALTGRRMDRLAEERRRGITIELNFAPLDLGDGRSAGVVDVPGHEDFIRTMVAGASGVDLVLLVIAADEGIMPQTREHLAIVEQLGVPAGIPVVTKADLVEEAWLELVLAEVDEWLRGSVVAFGPAIAVSAPQGRGISDLQRRIAALAPAADPLAATDSFRLPVDRSFSVAGVGTVVTGTAWSGSVAVGDVVRIMPAGREVRIRTAEMHGRKVARTAPRERTALGLVGVDREQVGRGDWLVAAAAPWTATTALDVEIFPLNFERHPFRPRTRLRVHLGTAEVLGRVHPREGRGADWPLLARLALEAPLLARGGDRLVLRSYSPVTTVGGARVLDPAPPRRGAAWPEYLSHPSDERRLEALVARRRYGIWREEVPLLLGCRTDRVEEVILASSGVRCIGDRVVGGDQVRSLSDRLMAAVRTQHQRNPAEAGLGLEALRRELRGPDWLVEALLAEHTTGGGIEVEGALVRERGYRPQVPNGDAELERLVRAVSDGGLAPPTLGELEARFGRRDVAALLRLAAGQGRVVPVERDRYFSPEALEQFLAAVREAGAGGAITPAGLRNRLGLSRKFLIPLLEWSDARGVTVRTGDARRLR
jgi:selenocysteine-specific elongation factor